MELCRQRVHRLKIISTREQRHTALSRGHADQKITRERGQFTKQRGNILAAGIQLIELQQRRRNISLRDQIHQMCGLHIARKTQHLQNPRTVHCSTRHAALVQKAQRITQRTVRQSGEQLRRVIFQCDSLRARDILQPSGDIHRLDAFECEALTAGKDRCRNLVQLRGSQNEDQMLRRLLQNFQKSIERRCGEHVDLVHDINAVLHARGRVDRLIAQRTNMIHAVVGRRVQLQNIQQTAVVDPKAGRALVARITVNRMLAVDRLGQDLRAGGLARAARSCKEIGVAEPPLRHLAAQRFGDVLLSDDIRECLRPPFAVKSLIHNYHSRSIIQKKHYEILSASIRSEPAPSRHMSSRLMLLGSPPDMVHRHPLRETGTSTRMLAEDIS